MPWKKGQSQDISFEVLFTIRYIHFAFRYCNVPLSNQNQISLTDFGTVYVWRSTQDFSPFFFNCFQNIGSRFGGDKLLLVH